MGTMSSGHHQQAFAVVKSSYSGFARLAVDEVVRVVEAGTVALPRAQSPTRRTSG